MTMKKSETKFTNVPQEIVDQCLSKRDAAYHEMDTLCVYIDVQLNWIQMRIEKLNSVEFYRYSIN